MAGRCARGDGWSSVTSGERVPRRRRDRVRGVEVSSLVGGPGPARDDAARDGTVILVHGLAVSTRSLVPSLRRLAEDRRVIAPDLPLVSRSSQEGRQLSMTELADRLVDWMDAVGLGSATLIGHSLGSQLVALLATRHPSRVTAVVLVSPAPDPGQRSLWAQAWALVVDGPRERPGMVLTAVADYLKVGPRWMRRAIRAAKRSDATPSLSRITQPTLVVRGERDPLVSQAWAEELVDRLPVGSLVTLPGAPHGVPYSAAEPFVAAVRAFLDRREDPATPGPPRS